MPQPHRWRRLTPLLLLAALAGCDRKATDPAGGEIAPRTDGVAPLLLAGPDAVPDRYLVVLNERSGSEPAAESARRLVTERDGQVHFAYERALRGFAATLTPEAVEALRRDPRVRYVAQDAWVEPTATQAGATWGLDRVDQRNLPLSATYTYGATGQGVRVYVIDSGIRTTHAEFGGRASVGTDFVGDGRNGQDCNGHGTHVAGTIAGATYGVAKAAQVIAVRIFPCSGGTTKSVTIAAVEWVTANAQKPAVVNMSLGGSFYAPENEAVQASIASGLVYVISAGNSNADACSASPASTPQAITVGASTIGDLRWSSSNWGACVDIFAPGAAITSAWWGSNTETNTINGTSMAAPHVSGVAALVLQGQPTATPAAVAQKIVSTGTMNRLVDVGTGSPNNLLFSGLTVEPPLPVIGRSPSSLAFTFVRAAPGTAALAADEPGAKDAPQPAMTAGGEGEAKPAQSDPAATTFSAATTGSTLSAPVILSNPGTGPLDWTATTDQPWLSMDPGDGLLSPTHNAVLTASVTPGTLPAGSHAGVITLQAPGATNSPLALPVALSLRDAAVLVPGTPRAGLAGAYLSESYFVLTVPAGVTQLTIATTGGTGDADLYVRYAQPPTPSEYGCRPYSGGNIESCTTTLPPAGTYYVMLRGFSAYGGVTLTATLGGPPAAPANLQVTGATATAVGLAWTDGSVNETSFALERATMSGAGVFGAWQNVASPAANAVTFSNAPVATGTTYRYRIRACNAAGCSAWATSGNATTPGVAPPLGVTAAATSATSIRVAWTDASTNETSFSFYRRTRTETGLWSAWTLLPVTAPANATSLTQTGLVTGSLYQYYVRACNAAGCSAWAVGPIVQLHPVPAAPTGVAAVQASPTSIRMTWTDASTGEASFSFFRRTRAPDGLWSAWTVLPATAAANATSYTHAGLTAGHLYQHQVRACNAAGCSAWAVGPIVTLATLPAAPTGVSATALSPTSIRVAWTDASTNETSFSFYRRTRAPDGLWSAWTVLPATAAANATAYTHAGLTAGHLYQYQVRSCNAAGCSAWAVGPIVTTPAS